MKKGFILLLVILLTISHLTETRAQDSTCCKPIMYLGARYHTGFFIQKPGELTNADGPLKPWTIEADISWHIRNKEIWNYCYCYPRTGFAIQYMNFDYPGVMGSALAFIPFIEPYIRASKKLNFSVRVGVGPTYLSKLYDEEINPENIFFSTHLSFTSHINFSVNYRLSDQLSMRLAGNFHHISNANLAQPNLGMNLPTLNAGFDYNFHKAYFEERIKDATVDLNPKKNRFDLIASLAGQHAGYYDSILRPVFTVSGNYSRVIGRVFGISAGIEFDSYRSMYIRIREKGMIDDRTGEYIDHKRLALTMGAELLMGKFILSPQMGYYLYCPYALDYKMYQRYTLSYKLTNHLLAGLSLKVHSRDVDFLDFRIGVFF